MKIKTHKSAAKRFNHVSGNRITRRGQSDQHLSRRKSKRSRRNAAKTKLLSGGNLKRVRQLISSK